MGWNIYNTSTYNRNLRVGIRTRCLDVNLLWQSWMSLEYTKLNWIDYFSNSLLKMLECQRFLICWFILAMHRHILSVSKLSNRKTHKHSYFDYKYIGIVILIRVVWICQIVLICNTYNVITYYETNFSERRLRKTLCNEIISG